MCSREVPIVYDQYVVSNPIIGLLHMLIQSTAPAVVYFPSGTYIISSSIVDYYFTQLIGNPNSRPILKATPNFSGFGLIDGDQYQAGGVLGFGATNVFYRQVRNFVLDMTAIPAGSAATGIHWPTAQATSVQNVIFRMSDAPGTKHQGFFIESGTQKLALRGRFSKWI